MIRIAHISDPHFGTVKPEILTGLVSALNELNPARIVLSGDISQRAHFKQFRQARGFVKTLKAEVIAIPGNHDIPLFNVIARFLYPYFGFKKIFKGHLQKTNVFDGIEVIALNSTSRFRWVQGDFNIRKLRNKLRKVPQDVSFRLVSFHHPMDCPKRTDIKNLLRGRDEAMKIFAQHHVDVILGGHIHDPYVSLSTDRYPQVERASVISVAGTCLSWRTRADAPNSFHLLELVPGNPFKLSIIRYDIDENFKFRPIKSETFLRRERGWEMVTMTP